MAGDWIKMRCNLDGDPRVIAISEALNITTAQVIGHLFQLWSWADQHTENGNAPSVTDVTILKRLCNAAPAQFCYELRKVGWLGPEENGLSIPHFEEHNGQSAKTRALTQKRVKRLRNDSVTLPSLPEKRREEKSTDMGIPAECSNHDKSARKTKPTFQPPTLDDCYELSVKIELPEVEAEKFFDHYTAVGWKVGRNPMKDWKAAMRKWKGVWETNTYGPKGKPPEKTPRLL